MWLTVISFIRNNKQLFFYVGIGIIAAVALRMYGNNQYAEGMREGKESGIVEAEKALRRQWEDREEKIIESEARAAGLMDTLHRATAEMVKQRIEMDNQVQVRAAALNLERSGIHQEVISVPDRDLWQAILEQVKQCRE